MRCEDGAKHRLAVSPDFRHHLGSAGGMRMATLTRRQKQLVDFLEQYIEEHGYAPTLSEIGQYFGLSSLATVHKHLKNLEAKGYIQRTHNHSRALEIAGKGANAGAREIALLGQVAAGMPIEAIEGQDTITVPDEFVRRDSTFCLRVKGESMVDEGIRDGDYIIVESRDAANQGETVVALIGGEATVKKFFREHDGRVRLQPANPTMDPIFVDSGDLHIRGVVVGLMRHYR
jgi:repressor LexA